MDNRPTVRFRVDFGGRCSVGIGKVELLEHISRTGSLSQAARDMRMSYRRAWLLLEDMNASFDLPVAKASVGGRGGGGVLLTEFGRHVVAAYRKLQADVQPLAAATLDDVGAHIRPAGRRRGIKAASIKGKPSAPIRAARYRS